MVRTIQLNARGHVSDTVYGCIKTDRNNGLGYEAIAERYNISVSTAFRHANSTVPPSEFPVRKAPPVSSSAKRTMAKRRSRVKDLIRKQEIVTHIITRKKKGSDEKQFISFPFGSPARVAQQLGVEGVEASASTVRRDVKALGIVLRRRPRRPQLTSENQVNRLKFARGQLRMTKATREGIIFSDEKWFNDDDHSRRFQYVIPGESVVPRRTTQFPIKVMIWGAVGVGFKQLVFFEKPVLPPRKLGRPRKGTIPEPKPAPFNVNATVYMEQCLTPLHKMLEETNQLDRQLMQDGSRAHTAGVVDTWLKNHNMKWVKNWPAHSPDLNPIETLWAWLQEKVSARGPKDAADLRRFIREEFDKFEQSSIDALVLKYEPRLRQCVAARGGSF
jgi:transposase